LNIAQGPAVKARAVSAGASEARGWTQILLRYREPSLLRSIFELAITFAPLAGLWFLMWLSYSFGFWWPVSWCACS
jgi:omega-6 fatty acid desaturase (delta-12 desaturase)